MANPVTEILEYLNDQVAKLSTTELGTIRSVLAAAEKELVKDLATWSALGKGEDRFTPHMYRNALYQISSTLDHIEGPMAEGVENSLKSGGRVAGVLATKHLRHEVETFSSMFEHSVRPVPFEVANVLAQGKKTLWPRFENSAERYAGQVRTDIQRQLAIGLVKGETIDQMTDRLAKLGGPKGFVYTQGRKGSPRARAEYIAEGLFTRYRHYAERLAVTETVNAYNATALAGMRELEKHDPGYFRRWDAAIDRRTCDNCARYDDLVVPLNDTFPGRIAHPPLHPRCRCAVVVWRKEWTESAYKDDLAKEATPGKKPGSVASVPHRVTVQDEKTLPKKETKAPKTQKQLKAKPEPTGPLTKDELKEWKGQKEWKADKGYFGKLTHEQLDAFQDYSGHMYSNINDYLRHGKNPVDLNRGDHAKLLATVKENIAHLDEALKHGSAPRAVTVYRGVRGDVVDQFKAGQVFQDKGYISTTADKAVGEQFAREMGSPKKAVFHIEIVKGDNIAPVYSHKKEQELLLPRDTKLEILEITEENGTKIVRARIAK
jgi:SPP1 gp7 family putative phage head morphogenesis protein